MLNKRPHVGFMNIKTIFTSFAFSHQRTKELKTT